MAGPRFDLRPAVISGTPENRAFLVKLDLFAAELTRLRDAKVTVCAAHSPAISPPPAS